MNQKLVFFGVLLSLCTFSAKAQVNIVKGTVIDAVSKEKLIGANVIVKGTETGTTTDINGNYKLKVHEGKYNLVISYVGYKTILKTFEIKAGQNITLDIELEEFVGVLMTPTVTSGKFEKPLGEVTVSLEVIKPTLIENANAQTVDVVLEKAPGLNIIDGQANIRSGSGYSYGAGSRVLLLIDDLPALQADAGFPNWRDIPVENIEQIEVVKGATSALYGSSALNGIINIRTAYAKAKPITNIATFGRLYLNPRDLQKKWWGDTTRYSTGLSVAHRQKFGKFDLVVGGNVQRAEFPRKELFTKYSRINFGTRYRLTDRLSFGINANINVGQSGNFFFWQNDSTGAYMPAENSSFRTDAVRTIIDPFVTYFDKHDNRHKFMGRYYGVNNENNLNNSVFSNLFYGEYQFQKKWANDWSITAGLVGMTTSSRGPLYGDTSYTTLNTAIYVQAGKKIGERLNVSVGARYEVNTISNPTITNLHPALEQQLGTTTIPAKNEREAKPVFRVGANYQVSELTYIRASWGQGYRFPTVAEKFVTTQIGSGGLSIPILPNPALSSETGWSAELGLKQGFKISNWSGFLDIAGYWMEYNDMMEFTFGGQDPNELIIGFQSVNIGDTRIRGVEVSLTGQGDLWGLPTSILTGYAYADPTFINFDERVEALSSADYNVLKYRFRHTFKIDAQMQWQQTAFGFAVNYTSHIEAIDAVFDLVIAGVQNYRATNNQGAAVVDARISHQFNDNYKVSFLVYNLFNNEYMIRPGLLENPISLSLRLDATF